MGDKDALMEMESQNLEVEKIRMYVIWYEYAQYLNDRKKLDKRIYKDWNLISGQKFDPWWKENWRLFAEPKKGLVKKVSSIPKSADSKKIYLEIPLDTNADTLVKNCKSIIDSELSKQKKTANTKPKLTKFPVEVKKNFDYKVWSRRLKCLKMKEEKYKLLDIFDAMQKKTMKVRKSKQERTGKKVESLFAPIDESKYWEVVKGEKLYSGGRSDNSKSDVVLRDIRLAKKFLSNISKGRFTTTFK
jgi:hypothetical protein